MTASLARFLPDFEFTGIRSVLHSDVSASPARVPARAGDRCGRGPRRSLGPKAKLLHGRSLRPSTHAEREADANDTLPKSRRCVQKWKPSPPNPFPGHRGPKCRTLPN
jgi:hypothetical protein